MMSMNIMLWLVVTTTSSPPSKMANGSPAVVEPGFAWGGEWGVGLGERPKWAIFKNHT